MAVQIRVLRENKKKQQDQHMTEFRGTKLKSKIAEKRQ